MMSGERKREEEHQETIAKSKALKEQFSESWSGFKTRFNEEL